MKTVLNLLSEKPIVRGQNVRQAASSCQKALLPKENKNIIMEMWLADIFRIQSYSWIEVSMSEIIVANFQAPSIHVVHTRCGNKENRIHAPNFYLKKSDDRNVYSLHSDVNVVPYPYTASCEFCTVESSAAGHLVVCYTKVTPLLLSLHPRTRTWFLWLSGRLWLWICF